MSTTITRRVLIVIAFVLFMAGISAIIDFQTHRAHAGGFSCANGATMTYAEVKDAYAKGHVQVAITFDAANLTATAVVKNYTDCAFPGSFNTYRMYDQTLNNQKFNDGTGVKNVAAHSTVTFTADIRDCMAQADFYYGDGPKVLRDDHSDGGKVIAWKFYKNSGSSYYNAAGQFCKDTPPPPAKKLTLVATKVVCDNESDLPDWSGDNVTIGKDTAEDYVASHSSCHLESGWQFQWGFGSKAGEAGVQDPGGSFKGLASTGTGYNSWKTFPAQTDANGKTSVTIDDLQGTSKIWVREALKDGYIPFTDLYQGGVKSESAEMWCNTDVLNYDNYDFVGNPVLGNTYYCVAFNAKKKSTPPPSFTGSCSVDKSSVDLGEDVTYTANASGGTGTYTYSWTGTDGLSGTSKSVTKDYSTTGTKTATVTITSGSKSITKDCTTKVETHSHPVFTGSCSVNKSSVETGEDVTFTADASGGTGNYTYDWTGTDGLSSNNKSVTKDYSSEGRKTATVKITSGSDSITKTCEVEVENDHGGGGSLQPSLQCIVDDTHVEIGEPVHYEARVRHTGGKDVDYDWDGSEGLHGNDEDVTKSYSTSGKKEAEITVEVGHRTLRDTCKVTVEEPEVLGVSTHRPGITLSQVPYTGAADTAKTVGALATIVLASIFGGYLIVRRKSANA